MFFPPLPVLLGLTAPPNLHLAMCKSHLFGIQGDIREAQFAKELQVNVPSDMVIQGILVFMANATVGAEAKLLASFLPSVDGHLFESILHLVEVVQAIFTTNVGTRCHSRNQENETGALIILSSAES